MRKYKTTGNTTLFDKEDTERKLTEMGDPLERLSKTVDFEMFRPELEDAKPRGAHLRVHGEHDAQAVHQDGRIGAGDGGDRADQPDLQHVALRANRQAQPPERLTEKKAQQATDTYIHTYAQTLKKTIKKFVK